MEIKNKENWIGLGVTTFLTDEVGKKVSEFTEWANSVKDAVKLANNEILNIESRHGNMDIPNLGGFYAEAFHSGSFNINAALKKSKYSTNLLNSNEAGSVDIESNWGENFSSKYYKTAKGSLDAQAKTFKGEGYTNSAYEGQKRLIPSDQLDDAKVEGIRKISKETGNRQDVANRYQETTDNLTDRIRAPDGTESTPLTKEEANEWARGVKKNDIALFENPNEVNIMAHVKEIGAAAGTAALISVTLQSVPVVISGVSKIFKEEEYSIKEFGEEISEWILEDAAIIGIDAFTKSALAGSICAAIKSGAIKGALAQISPEIIAGISVATIESAKSLWQWQRGKISGEKAASDTLKAGLRISSALAGKVAGQALIPIPIVGSILGTYIATLILEKGFDGIENSMSVKMLELIDESFYKQREVLINIFEINVNYKEVLDKYTALIDANDDIIISKMKQIESSEKLNEISVSINKINEDIISLLENKDK